MDEDKNDSPFAEQPPAGPVDTHEIEDPADVSGVSDADATAPAKFESPPKPGDRAEAAAKPKRPRRPFNPGLGGGWGFIFTVIVAAGGAALGYTVDISPTESASAETVDPASTQPEPEPVDPSTDRPGFDPDNPLARPSADDDKGKGKGFFGIPTN